MMSVVLMVAIIGNPSDNFMAVIDTQYFASRRSKNLSKSQIRSMTQTIEKICEFCKRPMTAEEYYKALKNLQKEKNSELTALLESQQKETQRKLKQQENDLGKVFLDRSKVIEERNKIFYKEDMDEKDKEIKSLKEQQKSFEDKAVRIAESKFERMIDDKNLQIIEKQTEIERVNKKLEDVQKGISHGSSELKGEAGERSLRQILVEANLDDVFKKQRKGVEEPDLIQNIKANGKFLDTKIGYDNKEGKSVTGADIKKAKRYQKLLKILHIIIVSKNVTVKKGSKNINVLITEREGILLVDPKIVVEVVRQIRKGIIEISKIASSREDRETKEAKLYEYVLSPEFYRIIEKLHSISSELYEQRDGEEKKHQTWWKIRGELEEQLRITSNDLASGVDSITQNQCDAETKGESTEEESSEEESTE